MKRASRSSTTSSPQIVLSSEASPALLPGSSLPAASTSNTCETLRRFISLMAATSSALRHRHAGHVVVRRRILLQVVAGHRLDDRLDLDLARAAAGAGPGRVADGLEGAAAAAQRADDGALRDAVAVADLGVVRQIGGRERGLRLAHREEQRGARLGQRRAAVEELLQRRRGAGVAEQDGAGELALADDQLVVDAAPRLGVGHDLVVGVAALLLAHDGEVDAHHLELRRGARAFVDLVFGARRVSRSASTAVCSHSGATRP